LLLLLLLLMLLMGFHVETSLAQAENQSITRIY
jgi:hypothetical protein